MEEMERKNISLQKLLSLRWSEKNVKIVCNKLLLQTELCDLNVQLFSSVFTKTMTATTSNTFQTFQDILLHFEGRLVIAVYGCFSGTLCSADGGIVLTHLCGTLKE